MLLHPSNPQHYLASPADLSSPLLDPRVQEQLPAFKMLLNWIEEFICQPHPQLGREGAVCPYVSTSREKNLFWLTAHGSARPGIEEVMTIAHTYRDWFLALEPREGGDAQYKTISILFPTLPASDAPDIIDRAHILLKPEFVNQGLMIGQFHALSNEPGVWNTTFHPLRSPVPLLVIRPMAPHDILFLNMDEQYVRAYLKVYGHRVPRRLQNAMQEAARKYGLSFLPGREANPDETGTILERQES